MRAAQTRRRHLLLPATAALAGVATLTAGTGIAFAQETADAIADLATAIDTAWLLITAVLVLFMQTGFAFLEAGFIRSKNVLDVSAGAVACWAVGFGLAYGAAEASNEFFGAGTFFLNKFDD